MITLSEYILEKAGNYGKKELVPEFKATKDAIVKVTYKPATENGHSVVYLQIDLWNNTLVCRLGITHQDKYAVAVWRGDNFQGTKPDLGPRKSQLIPFVNGGKYDAFHMGGKIQYTFSKEELDKLKKDLEAQDKDLIEKINMTIDAVDEFN